MARNCILDGTRGCLDWQRYSSSKADGVTQNGPQSTDDFDMLDREVARDTQGFDGSTAPLQRVRYPLRARSLVHPSGIEGLILGS